MTDHPLHKCKSEHESVTRSTTSRESSAGTGTPPSHRFIIQDFDIVGPAILIRAAKQRGEDESTMSRVFVIDFSNSGKEPLPFQNSVLVPFPGEISEEGNNPPEILVFDSKHSWNEYNNGEFFDEIRYLRDERSMEEQNGDHEANDQPPASDLWMFR
jgi:hypothetical protein